MNKVARIQEVLRKKLPEGTVVACHTETEHYYKYAPSGEVFPSVTTKTSILGSDHLKMWAVDQALTYIDARWNDITPENRSDTFRAARMAHVSTFEEAGDIGTRGHKVIEDYLNAWIATGIQPDDIRTFVKDDDVRVMALARSAELFCNDFHVIPIVSETKVASVRHGYGGTMDALMYVGKVIEVGDRNLHCRHVWSETSNHIECYNCNRKLKMTLSIVDWKSSNSVDKAEYAMQVSAYWMALYQLTGLRPEGMFIVRLDKQKAKYDVVRVTNRITTMKAFINCSQIYDWMHDGTSKLYPVEEKEVIKL